MDDLAMRLDAASQTVWRNGRPTRLPYRTWRVLEALVEAAPAKVSRHALIEQIWAGNFLTGDKGLTQAIWAIRRALADDARAPRYLETVPREGYRWLQCAHSSNASSTSNSTSSAALLPVPARSAWPTLAGSALGLGVLFSVSMLLLGFGKPSNAVPTLTPEQVENAYLWRDESQLVVELPEGCRRILKASPGKRIGASVLSRDGQRVVFEVFEAAECTLVEFDLLSNERRALASCLQHG